MIAECVRGHFAAMVFSLIACLVASPGVRAQAAPDYAALMAALDRSDADRKADTRRDPLPFLAFADLRPGMKVLDMGAGGGYSTELIARAVAPGGIVYGQNAPDLEREGQGCLRCAAKDSGDEGRDRRRAALRRPGASGRARSRPDHIPLLLPRYDIHERRSRRDGPQHVRRAQARRLFSDRRPFRLAGSGHSRSARRSHRIEESTLRKEVEAAGFRVVAEGNFWRHPDDTHDFPSYRPTMSVDEFVLKFQKPM